MCRAALILVLFAGIVRAQPKITEIHNSDPGNLTFSVTFEIFNSGPASLDIGGWTVAGMGGAVVLPFNSILPANGVGIISSLSVSQVLSTFSQVSPTDLIIGGDPTLHGVLVNPATNRVEIGLYDQALFLVETHAPTLARLCSNASLVSDPGNGAIGFNSLGFDAGTTMTNAIEGVGGVYSSTPQPWLPNPFANQFGIVNQALNAIQEPTGDVVISGLLLGQTTPPIFAITLLNVSVNAMSTSDIAISLNGGIITPDATVLLPGQEVTVLAPSGLVPDANALSSDFGMPSNVVVDSTVTSSSIADVDLSQHNEVRCYYDDGQAGVVLFDACVFSPLDLSPGQVVICLESPLGFEGGGNFSLYSTPSPGPGVYTSSTFPGVSGTFGLSNLPASSPIAGIGYETDFFGGLPCGSRVNLSCAGYVPGQPLIHLMGLGIGGLPMTITAVDPTFNSLLIIDTPVVTTGGNWEAHFPLCGLPLPLPPGASINFLFCPVQVDPVSSSLSWSCATINLTE